eukprot:4962642-Amphidinium_carterae.1
MRKYSKLLVGARCAFHLHSRPLFKFECVALAPLGAWSIIAEGESATKPHLSLTFSSLLSRSGSSIIAVESDVAALSLAVHDTLYRQGGVNSSVLLD